MRRIAPTSSRSSRRRLASRNEASAHGVPSRRRSERRSSPAAAPDGRVGRSLFAYVLGFLASAATSFGVYLGTHAVVPAPVLDADAVVGSELACAVICRRSACRGQARAQA